MARDYGLSPSGGVGSMRPGRVMSVHTAAPRIPQGVLPAQPAAGGSAGMSTIDVSRKRQNSLYKRALELMKRSGRTQKRQVRQGMQKDLASSEQDLISRGLGNTTIRGSERRGIKSDARSHLDAINENRDTNMANILMQQAGGDLNMSGMQMNMMGQNQQDYIRLMQQLGAAGAR